MAQPEELEHTPEHDGVDWSVVVDIALGVGGVGLFAYGLEVGGSVVTGVGLGLAAAGVFDLCRNDGQQRSDTV